MSMTMSTTIIYNGEMIPSEQPCIKHNDRGFSLGHGIFETILIKKNTIPALRYHWRRLKSSADSLDILVPFTFEELSEMLFKLIKYHHLENQIAGARLTLTYGEAARGILPSTIPVPNFTLSVFEHHLTENGPYSALTVKTKKNEHSQSSQVKSLSYLDNILAKKEAFQQGYDEAILLNTQGNIADGSISNIFVIIGDEIFTPPVKDGALPGVVRSMLLEDFQIEERVLSLQELMDAEEVFLTNALMGIRPLTKLNNKTYHCIEKSTKLQSIFREQRNYL